MQTNHPTTFKVSMIHILYTLFRPQAEIILYLQTDIYIERNTEI